MEYNFAQYITALMQLQSIIKEYKKIFYESKA